jgi:hypothetical protein
MCHNPFSLSFLFFFGFHIHSNLTVNYSSILEVDVLFLKKAFVLV